VSPGGRAGGRGCRGEGEGKGSPLTDASLLNKLGPFIGDVPMIRPHASRLAVATTQLSFVKDSLKEAMQLYMCEKMPNKKLPSSDWMIWAHAYKNRYVWEPASWARLHVRIQSIGYKVRSRLAERSTSAR